MKKRYNISIDIDIMEEAKATIPNISKYIEVCLLNHNKTIKNKNSFENRIKRDLKAKEEYIKNRLYYEDLIKTADVDLFN